MVNKLVKDRIRAKRHVFLEQPQGSQWLEEEELADVVDLINKGILVVIKVDGCQVGYKDAENGLPHYKPSLYVTSLLAAETIFQDCRCDGQHQHQPLEGRNKFGLRTLQASVWPDTLNEMVIQAMLQQGSAELTAANIGDAFPSEVRPAEQQFQGRTPKRQRRAGRAAQLVGQYNAPPVYIRPHQPAVPELPALPAPEHGEVQEAPQHPPPLGDDASFRASQVAELDPVLNITEAERRRRWLTISPEVRKILRDLHVQFGHPTNTTRQRILRRQGALPEAIQGADLLNCDACGNSIGRRRPKPVRLPGRYVFNHHVLIDVFYGKDVTGASFSFLNIVDDATGYQVVSCLGQAQGPPASKAILRHFLTSWSSWAGLPQSIQVDRGKEYLAFFSEYLKSYGVEQETIPLEAPWQDGKCEKAGDLWKQVLHRSVQDMQLQGLDDMMTATSIITQCRNSFPRPTGYSPVQWVLGLSEVRIPGSLLDEDEAQRLEILEAADDPTSALARSLGIRESARVAQIRLDNDARVRRALLHKSTPTRGPYPVGSYVYFYRLQTPAGDRAQGRSYRWFGPARVIGVETRNQRRAEYPELLTEGGQPHAYWLRYGPSVVLVTGEQLRFASEDELLAAHYLPQEVLQPSYARGARNYVDLRGHAALPQQQQDSEEQDGSALQFSPSQPAVLPSSSARPRSIPEDVELPLEPPPKERTGDGIFDAEPEPAPSAAPSRMPSKAMASTEMLPPQQDPPALVQPPAVPPVQTPLTLAMQQPNRLDGHPYNPMRTTMAREPGPYFVDDDPWDCPDLPHAVRLKQLKHMNNSENNFEDEDQSTDDDETSGPQGHDQRSPESQRDQRFQSIDWPDGMGHETNQTRPHGERESMGSPKVKDVVNLSKAVKALKETSEATWRFVYSPELTLKDIIVCVFSDSSFANLENVKSQCGYVVTLTLPSIKDGPPTPLFVVETYSGSIKPVCRSTLAAESNGFLTGAEAGDYVRSFLLELQFPNEKFNDLEREFVKKKLLCMTDAKSLESTLNKDAGQPADKRVRILVAQIRELIGGNDYESDEPAYAQWLDTSQMLADVLTKTGCEREPLLSALFDGKRQLEPTEDAKAKKASIRASRHARRQLAALRARAAPKRGSLGGGRLQMMMSKAVIGD
eukprot:s1878_g10.t1